MRALCPSLILALSLTGCDASPLATERGEAPATETDAAPVPPVLPPRCGDGRRDPGEACDGVEVGGLTCAEQGFYGGVRRCMADCRIEERCAGQCGDGRIDREFGEVCDGDDLGGVSDCAAMGYASGRARCVDACRRVDTGECRGICGDGVIDTAAGEICDGDQLDPDQTCEAAGFQLGVVRCREDCRGLDLSGCHGLCGDGWAYEGAGEVCDGEDLAGAPDCAARGFYAGTIECEPGCKYVIQHCEGRCGDGEVEAARGEACDGADLAGESCTSFGFRGGDLTCDRGCAFDTGGCIAKRCGDGVRDPDANPPEACDVEDFGGASCVSLGFRGGRLACDAGCGLDPAACVAARCHDDVLDLDEECEGDLFAERPSCLARGYEGGTLACRDCRVVADACCLCGNGRKEDACGEACDGADLAGASCADVGLGFGEVRCGAGCELDYGACHNCGDGHKDPGEACDGEDFGGDSCTAYGFQKGHLVCTANCRTETTSCRAARCGDGEIDADDECEPGVPIEATCTDEGHRFGSVVCTEGCRFDYSDCNDCGDGVKQPEEACDGSDLGDASCTARGFAKGALACDETCQLDASGCRLAACGDNEIDAGEECDNAEFGGFDCRNFGHARGVLRCIACRFDVSGCIDARCGDGHLDAGEDCEPGLAVEAICADRGHEFGTVTCAPSCDFDYSACNDCGDGVRQLPEACDFEDLGGETCEDQGFDKGALRCDERCRLDPSDCRYAVCGDGEVDEGEACDGMVPPGMACEGPGGGMLRCVDCQVDDSACDQARCGDGVCAPTEDCNRCEPDCGCLESEFCDDAGRCQCAYEARYLVSCGARCLVGGLTVGADCPSCDANSCAAAPTAGEGIGYTTLAASPATWMVCDERGCSAATVEGAADECAPLVVCGEVGDDCDTCDEAERCLDDLQASLRAEDAWPAGNRPLGRLPATTAHRFLRQEACEP